MFKNDYYGNEGLGLAWDFIEVLRNQIKVFEMVFQNHVRVQEY